MQKTNSSAVRRHIVGGGAPTKKIGGGAHDLSAAARGSSRH